MMMMRLCAHGLSEGGRGSVSLKGSFLNDISHLPEFIAMGG